ncbi:MAG: C1 family peptidase, partial [Thermoplasmatota archaeon]
MKASLKILCVIIVATIILSPLLSLNSGRHIHYIDASDVTEGRKDNNDVPYGTGCIEEEATESEMMRGAVPSSWDWREHDIMTPVKNQGSCGSCVAFATAGAFEAIIKLRDDTYTDLSEAHMYFCSDRSCDSDSYYYGWQISKALNFLKGHGACNESCFPYNGAANGKTLPCDPCDGWEEQAAKISEWA